MKSKLNQCPHIENHQAGALDLQKLQKVKSCASCDYAGPNLWICLKINCLRVGCSEQANDHSTQHFEQNKSHCVHMNLSSQRAWCYLCESEVFLPQQQQYANIANDAFVDTGSGSYEYASNGNENELLEDPKGLVGLHNLANTCYMNSALQALSNVQPVTQYFLDCSDLVDHTISQSNGRSRIGLAKSYQQLIKEIWGDTLSRKEIIAPRGILYGIRSVHPMFRGFQQHDTQEFLRCFMDQLHEELKEQNNTDAVDFEADDDSVSSTFSCPSQRGLQSNNESDYDTCDSFESTNALLNEPKNDSAPAVANKRTLSNTTNASEKLSSSSVTHNSDRSIITDVFDGKLLSSVQCLTCDRISTREETFQDLSLPIPNRDFLNILHQSHSASAQSLTSIDANVNNSVGWMSWLWNMLRLWFWGPTVTLYDCMASFFSADELKGDNMYSCEKCQKLRTGVKYSRILNLPEVLCIHLKRFRHDLSCSSKIHANVQFPLENFDMTQYLHKNCGDRIAHYNLVSVICHHGTVGGGHYTSFARNPLNNRWYEYDDQYVTETSAEVVQRCQAYVLFYRKHNPQMDIIRRKARDISPTNPLHLTDIRFYINKEWLVRFHTFAEPGPINNWSMLCPHGGILQSKAPLLNQIAIPIAQPLWDYLYEIFGGGPVVTLLFECKICKQAADALKRRQFFELSVFTKYNDAYTDLEANEIFAISMPWLRAWQQFAKGVSNREPGPINNKDIANTAEDTAASSSLPICKVRAGLDYAQICAPLWRFLHGIYGGGPEIVLRGSQVNEQFVIIDQDDELDWRRHSQSNAAGSSDTESNIGTQQQQLQRSQQDQEQAHEYLPILSAETIGTAVNNSCSDMTTDEDSDRVISNQQEEKDIMSSNSAKDAKRMKHPTVAYKKAAVKPLIFKGGLRKKDRNNYRLSSKNGDFFGPKGTFNKISETPADNELSDEAHLSEHSRNHFNAKAKANGFERYRQNSTSFHSKKQARRQLKQHSKAKDDSTTTITAVSNSVGVGKRQKREEAAAAAATSIYLSTNEHASESLESDA